MPVIKVRKRKNQFGISFCKCSNASMIHTKTNRQIATITRAPEPGTNNIAQASSDGITDSSHIVCALLGALSANATAPPHWIPPRNERMTAA
jgi:hypothetical protein